MTDIQRAARTVLLMKLVGDIAKEEGDAAKTAAGDAMRATGAERVRVTDEAGENVGAVSLASRRPTARVVDEQAFTAWVMDRYPDEVVSVVRESFRRRLLDDCKTACDSIVPATGEVIPGVEMRSGDGYVSARPTSKARDRMRAVLAAAGLLAVEGGDR